MSAYIASNDNRLYAALEPSYGEVPSITSTNRFPAVKLRIKQTYEKQQRRDKTGTRTFTGLPNGTRTRTAFQLQTYLTTWSDTSAPPGYGPLFGAALGSDPLTFSGGTIASAPSSSRLTLVSSHNLVPGQAITVGNEMRFVKAVLDSRTVELNAPMSQVPPAGATAGPTLTYLPDKELPSVSIFDYRSPSGTVQRVLTGGAADSLRVRVNGDFHEFEFQGPASDVFDTSSFAAGQGGLDEFPAEPQIEALDPAVIPGHMGQVWLGAQASRFYTLKSASVQLNNSIELRNNEFGTAFARGITPGQRTVSVDFDVYATNDAASRGLYEAARQRSPIGAMFQLGQQQGQLFGALIKAVVPECPDMDDTETRLVWRFADCRAQGSDNDELAVAFG